MNDHRIERRERVPSVAESTFDRIEKEKVDIYIEETYLVPVSRVG